MTNRNGQDIKELIDFRSDHDRIFLVMKMSYLIHFRKVFKVRDLIIFVCERDQNFQPFSRSY